MKPALIIVDLQNDFYLPDAPLSIPSAPIILPPITTLLSLPIPLRLATQDWHPLTHTSFASNHSRPPFTSTTIISSPANSSETIESRLWPVHCVQGTHGAQLVDGIDWSKVHGVIKKGMNEKVEMYSAFYAPFQSSRVEDTGLAERLKSAGITHVYVVGLAADYCVKATALDAHKEGFTTYIVEEATKPVDVKAWPQVRTDIQKAGVAVVSMDGPEIAQLKSYQP